MMATCGLRVSAQPAGFGPLVSFVAAGDVRSSAPSKAAQTKSVLAGNGRATYAPPRGAACNWRCMSRFATMRVAARQSSRCDVPQAQRRSADRATARLSSREFGSGGMR